MRMYVYFLFIYTNINTLVASNILQYTLVACFHSSTRTSLNKCTMISTTFSLYVYELISLTRFEHREKLKEAQASM